MDIFGTTITAVHEIWAVTMFIKEIVNDVQSYDRDKVDIQTRLSHEFLFFDDFKVMFFDGGPGREFYRSRPTAFQEDCDNILKKFQEILGEYKAKATKYGLVDLDEDSDNGSVKRGIIIPKDRWLSRFKNKMVAQMTDLKTKAVNWSIFDKKAIFDLLDKFRSWTERLRETVLWMLSTSKFKEGFTPDPDALRKMQLLDAYTRQESTALADPPKYFGPLVGFVQESKAEGNRAREPILAKFSEFDNDWEDAQDVIMETKKYKDTGKDAIRRLAFLLSKSTFSQAPDATSTGPALLSFNFKGYLDLPDGSGVLFIYDPPTKNTSSAETLYHIINTPPSTRPTLGNRFFLAHTLAVTVLNIHGSRWVHKNIWSKGVVICASPNVKQPLRADRLVPYLCGWEVAREEDSTTFRTADHDVLANLYRHPRRQGQPTVEFKSEHDMYALGVVLIEIGLWQTVDTVFSAEIAKGRVGPNRLVRWWDSDGSNQVKAEMGEGYAEVVSRCLDAKKKILGEGTEERYTGLIAFRDKVVDVLAMGLEL